MRICGAVLPSDFDRSAEYGWPRPFLKKKKKEVDYDSFLFTLGDTDIIDYTVGYSDARLVDGCISIASRVADLNAEIFACQLKVSTLLSHGGGAPSGFVTLASSTGKGYVSCGNRRPLVYDITLGDSGTDIVANVDASESPFHDIRIACSEVASTLSDMMISLRSRPLRTFPALEDVDGKHSDNKGTDHPYQAPPAAAHHSMQRRGGFTSAVAQGNHCLF